MMCERKILVVDDEVDLLQMIETTLNTEGFDIIRCDAARYEWFLITKKN